MKIYNSLFLKVGGGNKKITFGTPNNSQEFEQMFKLRHEVYSSRKYIEVAQNTKFEKDALDENQQTVHFIVKLDNNIIGTVRIIRKNILPTEEYFHFKEPNEMKIIGRAARAELGRLIVIPTREVTDRYLPRGLVMLFLLRTVVDYFNSHNIQGGYAFIKSSLKKKILKRKMPVRFINEFSQTYPPDGTLFNYFNQPEDIVVPIYFRTKDFDAYTQKMLHSWFMFKVEKPHSYILRDNLYNLILKFLGFI